MAAVDMAVFEQPIASDTAFDLHQALAFMRRMSLEDRSEFIVGLTLNQATDVLSEMPFREVNELLEQLEESGHEGRARQISMVLGLISSEAEPAGDYLDNSVLSHVRERVGWIVGLALMGIVSGLIISKYEDAISTLVLLAIYMPVVAAAGGNTGSQAATLVVRALATNDITLADWAKVLWKEFRISLLIAGVLASVIVGRVVLFSGDVPLPGGLSLYHKSQT